MLWFNILLSAIIMQESSGDPSRWNINEDAVGILQLRKIYVEEANIISGKSFQYEDRWDVSKSIEMFIIVEEYHNPDWDIDLALHIHNAGAYNIDSRWELTEKYRKEVKDKMLSIGGIK